MRGFTAISPVFAAIVLCAVGCNGHGKPESVLDKRMPRFNFDGSLKEAVQGIEASYKLKIECEVDEQVLNRKVSVRAVDIPLKNALWWVVRVADRDYGIELLQGEQPAVRIAEKRKLGTPWAIPEDEAANRRTIGMLDTTRIKVNWVDFSPADCLANLLAMADEKDPKLGAAISSKTQDALSRAAVVNSGPKEQSLGEAIRSLLQERGFTLQVVDGFLLVEEAPKPAPK